MYGEKTPYNEHPTATSANTNEHLEYAKKAAYDILERYSQQQQNDILVTLSMIFREDWQGRIKSLHNRISQTKEEINFLESLLEPKMNK